MGSFVSKINEEPKVTPRRTVIHSKLIEDPRSPTEEICRTPIEVDGRISKESEVKNSLDGANFRGRVNNILKESRNTDFSPQMIKGEGGVKELRKLSKPFFAKIENEYAANLKTTTAVEVSDTSTKGKENDDVETNVL